MSDPLIESFIVRHALPEEFVEALHELLAALAGGEATKPPRGDEPTLRGSQGEGTLPGARTDGAVFTFPGQSPRFVELSQIGVGGMGEVWRVRDHALGRTVAMKVLLAELGDDPQLRARFLQEAQIQAQLQHPGVVPLHDLGVLADGRPFFTMKEIQGRTIGDVIRELHQVWRTQAPGAVSEGGWRATPSGWTLRRLLSAFHRVCETIAFAHSRGVLHRDLKPNNMMVGEFGEVLVLDWGLTRVDKSAGSGDSIVTIERGVMWRDATRLGTISGTLSYMPPEQALGDSSQVSKRSDVYSLGAVLYEILTDQSPYADLLDHRSVRGLLEHPPTPVRELLRREPDHPVVADELLRICETAMARDAADRYADAALMAADLAAWLDGAQKRVQAGELVEQARAMQAGADAMRARADELHRRAAELMKGVALDADVAVKLPAWTLEDEMEALRRETDLTEERAVQLLRAALTYAPDLELAHDLLADRFHRLHVQAEQQRDPLLAARHEILLREHGSARYGEYLRGDGTLTLVTDPPGATAELHAYVREGRRLRPSFLRDLGPTPLERLPLAMGSYLVVVRAPGRAPVRYPVFIERLHHWDSAHPSGGGRAPIYLPRVEELGPDECYVPAGWFHSGGDPAAKNSLPARRLWLDGCVLRRFPVTIGEYLEFLNDLAATGRMDAAAQYAPPVPAWEEGRSAAGREPGVARDADGRFILDGPAHTLRWPVAMVNWEAANAYATWFAARTGQAWRLCAEMEHEKALRGVDARAFPWGEFLDPTFCCMRLSHQHTGRALRSPVDDYPDDESVYGIRGLAGNVHTWCADAMQISGPRIVDDIPQVSDGSDIEGVGAGGVHRVVRGGCWRSTEDMCRGAFREGPPAVYRDTVLGLRLARSLP